MAAWEARPGGGRDQQDQQDQQQDQQDQQRQEEDQHHKRKDQQHLQQMINNTMLSLYEDQRMFFVLTTCPEQLITTMQITKAFSGSQL